MSTVWWELFVVIIIIMFQFVDMSYRLSDRITINQLMSSVLN